jgi:hypothetical protein
MHEARNRARGRGRGPELPLPLQVLHPPGTCTGSAIQQFSEPTAFGFLWRTHYIGIID